MFLRQKINEISVVNEQYLTLEMEVITTASYLCGIKTRVTVDLEGG